MSSLFTGSKIVQHNLGKCQRTLSWRIWNVCFHYKLLLHTYYHLVIYFVDLDESWFFFKEIVHTNLPVLQKYFVTRYTFVGKHGHCSLMMMMANFNYLLPDSWRRFVTKIYYDKNDYSIIEHYLQRLLLHPAYIGNDKGSRNKNWST